MKSRIVVFALVLFTVPLVAPPSARAQGGLNVIDPQFSYKFGESLTFTARLDAPGAIQEASLAFQSTPPLGTQVIPAGLDGDQVRAEVNLTGSRSLRAFSHVTYWYLAVLEDGQSLESERFTFTYEDNRFEAWQTLEETPFRIHWYEGDQAFARGVLDTAQIAMRDTKESLQLATPANLDIYVYADPVDLQYALRLTGPDWVAGHASPDLGVILVSIVPGPEERFEMERQIPHELAHVMLYTTLGIGYAQLPVWLNEGIASASEFYVSPDYREALDLAAQDNSFIPLTALCETFPSDKSGAALAYAESASFVNYLYDRFGAASLYSLVVHYSTGQGCDAGPQPILGQSLTELDLTWRQASFPGKLNLGPVAGALPWYLLALVVLAAPFIMMLFSLIQRRAAKAP